MSNPSIGMPEEPGLLDRFRRELRNPSMMTVFLIILSVSAIPLAILVPSWVNTTKESFKARSEAKELRDEFGLLSSSVLVPSQIVPWMFIQIDRMENADSPADWNYTPYTAGPCDATNLSQLPAGPYATAIGAACATLHQVQTDHADECKAIQTCNLSDEAITGVRNVRQMLLDVFAEADFVAPYKIEEEGEGQ